MPVEHIYPRGQARLLERFSQAAQRSPVERPVADNSQVEVGVVPGGPGRPGAERPYFALAHVLGKDALDDREMGGTEVYRASHSQGSPVITLHRLMASLVKAGMVLMALAAFTLS